METLKEDNNITIAEYAKECKLVDTPGRKWTRKLTNNPKKLIRMAKIFASQNKLNTSKYKYWVQVRTNYSQTLELDNQNGDNLWQDVAKNEMDQIKDPKTFKAMKGG